MNCVFKDADGDIMQWQTIEIAKKSQIMNDLSLHIDTKTFYFEW